MIIPVDPIVAIPGDAELHTPPGTMSVAVITPPTQTDDGPPIGAGAELTATRGVGATGALDTEYFPFKPSARSRRIIFVRRFVLGRQSRKTKGRQAREAGATAAILPDAPARSVHPVRKRAGRRRGKGGRR